MDRGIIKFNRNFESKELFLKLTDLKTCEIKQIKLREKLINNVTSEDVELLKSKRQLFMSLNFKQYLFNYYKQQLNLEINSKVVIYEKKLNNIYIKEVFNVKNKLFTTKNQYRYQEFKKIKNKYSKITFICYDCLKDPWVEVYNNVYQIILNLIEIENIYIYKPHEIFIDLIPVLKEYNLELTNFVKAFQKLLNSELNINTKIGIGTNMVSSKFAIDLYATFENNYLSFFNTSTYQEFLKRTDLENIWSLSDEHVEKLRLANIFDVDTFVALTPRSVLKILGTKGSEIQNNLKLKDKSNWKEKSKGLILNLQTEIINYLKPEFKTVSKSKTILPTNDQDEINALVYENIVHCCQKLTKNDILARTVKIQIYYENFNNINFISQKTFEEHTNTPQDIFIIARQVLDKQKNSKKQIKRVVVSLDNLIKNQGQKPQISFDFEQFLINDKQIYTEM